MHVKHAWENTSYGRNGNLRQNGCTENSETMLEIKTTLDLFV